MSELPKGWAAPGLAEICTFNPKHDPKTGREQLVSFVPMPAVSDERGAIETPQDRPLSEIWKGYTHFQNGDVIFAKITPCMENGKSAVAADLTNGLACGSTEFHVLRPEGGVLPDYIWRFVRQVDFRKDAESQMTGAVGQRRVPKTYLEKHPIPLPPLHEQRRIVRKLDTLSARTTTARTHLTAITKLVERYKRAVVESLVFRIAEDLPKARLEEICTFQNGFAFKSELFKPTGLPVLRISNIFAGEIIDKKPVFADPADYRENLDAYMVPPGSLLIAMSGATTGKVGFNRTADTFLQNQRVGRFIPHENLDLRFLFYCLDFNKDVNLEISAGSAQPNLSTKQIKEILLPDFSLAQQREIVRRIEAAFAKIDRLAAEAEKALKLSDRLDQRILAKAFAGALVAQDPADEPATELLARIREARSNAPKPKRGRRKKVAT